MSEHDIQAMVLGFLEAYATQLWSFSEGAGVPIGDFAPVVFGLMLGSAPVKVS